MQITALRDAVTLAKKLGHIFIGTVGQDGVPHIAAAGKLNFETEDRVEVMAWFCPTTVANLQVNRAISLVIWDLESDKGFQLLGETEQIVDLAFLDGYIPGQEESHPVPQIERKLVIRVDKILDFTHAPHSDIETA